MESKVRKLLMKRPQLTRNSSAHSLQLNLRKPRTAEQRLGTPKFSEGMCSAVAEPKGGDRTLLKDSNEFTFAKNKEKLSVLSERNRKSTSPYLINRIRNSKSKLKMPLGRNGLRRFCHVKTILTGNEPINHFRNPSLYEGRESGKQINKLASIYKKKGKHMTRIQTRCNSVIRFTVNLLYGEGRKSQVDLERQKKDGNCRRRVVKDARLVCFSL
eukprot:TRINITY_DN2148_c0_g1_i5.p1 TRINITY_DN2148_c0_g1~~TRINITY_DN2148_c0_g1_i5.p1  ORF type:complete len:214 (+),score=40.63 TRINITY_DN2148_c0_g1_i5:143-784(+)